MDFALREWRQSDAAGVAKYANNGKIACNLRDVFPHPYTLTDAEYFVNSCLEADQDRQLFRAIEIDGHAVGSISLCLGSDVYARTAELGYWLAEEHWGKGVMTESVRQICREAFDRFDILRIFAEPFADNQGSRRVLEKAGFTCEGTMRNGVCKNGRVHSYCMYALLREELD